MRAFSGANRKPPKPEAPKPEVTDAGQASYCRPVADIKPGGTLARTHEGQPGLPRGRNRLPLRAVRASQRERLLRSVIAAVSEIGYPAVTVADVVRRARVSRAAFYAHFADKEECFLTATGEGRQLMFAGVVSAARAVPADAPDEQTIRAAYRAFLAFLTDEPAFARVFYIDMPAAGPRAVGRIEAASRPSPGSSISTCRPPARGRSAGSRRRAGGSPT